MLQHCNSCFRTAQPILFKVLRLFLPSSLTSTRFLSCPWDESNEIFLFRPPGSNWDLWVTALQLCHLRHSVIAKATRNFLTHTIPQFFPFTFFQFSLLVGKKTPAVSESQLRLPELIGLPSRCQSCRWPTFLFRNKIFFDEKNSDQQEKQFFFM